MFENLFDNWDTQTWAIAFFLVALPVYVAWFVNIPSAAGGREGLNLVQKLGVTLVMPIAVTYFINTKKNN